MGPLVIVGVVVVAVGWWRRSRPPRREVPALLAALGFRHQRRRFPGRGYDAGEPALTTRRGYTISATQHERPIGPGDVDISLHVGLRLQRRAPSGLAPWLALHPPLDRRLRDAGEGLVMRWELAPDGHQLGFVWGDPRCFEWTAPRLDACIGALLDLAISLDARE